MSVSPYLGIYINLDRSVQRREEIEEQLRVYNLRDRYSRLSATDGAAFEAPATKLTPGETGCFHSHYRALLEAQAAGQSVHVIEDDIVLSGALEGFARKAFRTGLFDNYDMIFTDTFVYPNSLHLRFLKEAANSCFGADGRARQDCDIRLYDLGSLGGMAGMTSYFVGKRSLDKVLRILQEEWDAGPRLAVDNCLARAVQRRLLKIGCTAPFLTSPKLEFLIDSTIAGRWNKQAALDMVMQGLLRYSFFIGRDLDHASRFLRQMIDGRAPPDPHQKFLAGVLGEMIPAG